MTETGQDIEVKDEMTITELMELMKDTQGRFCYVIDPSGLFATCRWVNYKKKNGRRSKNSNGNWNKHPHARKDVIIIREA